MGPLIEGIAGSSKVLASDAYKWFEYLKGQNTRRLKLHYQNSPKVGLPDRISTAFVGGGSHWFVEFQFGTTSDIYLSEWLPSEGMSFDRRKTHYFHIGRDTTHLDDASLSVTEAGEKLASVLHELAEFARKHDHLKHWAVNFNNAITTLESSEPQESDEFLPVGAYSVKAHQLILGSFASWVFGGMGSWSDLAFNDEDQEHYESLSETLYTALCDAIVSGVNSFS